MNNTAADSFQTSPYQEALWLAEPDGPTARVQGLITLAGSVDRAQAETALRQSVDRHEILRTTFMRQPGITVPLQVVNEQLAPAFTAVDLSGRSSDEQDQEIAGLRAGELAAPLDPEHGPLVRAVHVELGAGRAVLVLTLSGLIADAGSVAVLAEELADALGHGGGPAEDPLQYADYAAWQRELAESDEPERHSAAEFWRDAVAPALAPIPFTDAGAAVAGSWSSVAVDLDDALATALRAGAGRYGASVSALVQAAWQTLLHRLGGEDAVAVAYVASERRHGDLDGAVGAFSRPVPVRAVIAGATFAEVLGEVERGRERALVAQDYAPIDGAGQMPVAFVATAGHDVIAAAPWARLVVTCAATESELTVHVGSDPGFLAAEHRERIARQLGQLLRSIASDPGGAVASLELLDEAERRQVLVDFNAVAAPASVGLAHELFAQHAAAAGSVTAVVDEHGPVSYEAIDAAANQLAHRLVRAGVAPGDAVGLCTDRSREMVIGLLGILKAGAAYVPLHFEHPAARLGHQLATAGARVIVTQEPLLGHLPDVGGEVICLDRERAALAAELVQAPDVSVSADQLAYVIYTSGSTGVPKGVGVTHANLGNYVAALAARLGLGPDSEPLSFGVVTALSTDLGNTSLFGALCSGGTLVLVSPAAAADAGAFARVLSATPVDLLKITPSHIGALVSGGDAGVLPRRWLVIGGERAPWDLVERVQSLAPDLAILNHYGPTETTIGATACVVGADSRRYRPASVPIGSALAGNATYVLDPLGAPVPIGVHGHLFVAGAGVARGYVGSDQQTAERFVEDPFVDGRRMYDTGDVVRWLPDGMLEFVGRVDEQVKIRGYRVEPAEIETALRSHPRVTEAVVVAQASPAGDARLVAYCVGDGGGGTVAVEELRAHLAEWVPEFMLPSAIVVLDSLPRTASGKIDRLALPDPAEVAGPDEDYVAPRSAMEEAVAAIWIRVLGVDQIGVHDDFFSLGGHSLLATQVVAQVRSDFAVDLPLHSLFTFVTIESLTEEIVRMMGDSDGEETARLVAELENLSDEDAERLLAGEESPS